MGTLIRSLILASMLACTLSACGRLGPCGWDESLALGASYDVELLEKYTTESTMAVYLPEYDQTRPAPTCDGLGDIAVGETLTVRTTEAPDASQDCSFWFGEITSPSVDLGTRLPIILNNRSYNQLIAAGRWDYGSGCEGIWEFSVHAPEDDPFRPQSSSSIPAVVGYRVFEATAEVAPACAALVGREPEVDGFRCGDAYIASMAPAAAP